MPYEHLDRSRMASLITSSRMIYRQAVILHHLGLPKIITKSLQDISLALISGTTQSVLSKTLHFAMDDETGRLYVATSGAADCRREHAWAEKQFDPWTYEIIRVAIINLKVVALEASALDLDLAELIADLTNVILLIGWWMKALQELCQETALA